MTPEEFEAFLQPRDKASIYTLDDGMRFAESVAGLNEKERKALSKTAKAYWKKLGRFPFLSNDYEFACLVVLAICPLSDAKKVEVRYFQRQEDAATKILIDRRPDWLDEWVAHKLDEEWPGLSWKLLRALVCAGVCKKPNSRGYAIVMSWGVLRDGKVEVDLCKRLANEPDLLDDIWQFFEHDVCPFYERNQWTSALCELSNRGIIDRDRLLDSVLQALYHDIKDDVRSGFIGFYQAFEPTAEERAARQAIYFEMLSHRASPVVGVAIDELIQLEKQGALDAQGFLTSARSVFTLKPKGQPLAVLKLANRVIEKQPHFRSAAMELAIEGLSHDSADVQQRAIDLIERGKDRLHGDHLIEIRQKLSGLTAVARMKAEALLASAAPLPATSTAESPAKVASQSAVRSQAESIDPKWRALAGIDSALDAMESDTLPPALLFQLLDVPVLTGTQPVVPIQSIDELLDATAHAIEVIESADEVERILDGISRLCDQRPADFALRAAPLAVRLLGEPSQEAMRGLRNAYLVPAKVSRLILSWLTGQRHKAKDSNPWGRVYPQLAYLQAFFDRRAEEIEQRVLRGAAAPMLSAPTHAFGWLDSLEFVRRLKSQHSVNEVPSADLIQALLRVAPDHRGAALAEASDILGSIGRAVRWGLGGDDRPDGSDGEIFAIWLAAGRARNPYGALTELEPILRTKEGAWALSPAIYDWRTVEQADEPFHYRPSGAVALLVTVNSPNIDLPQMSVWPTLALSQVTNLHVWGFTAAWKAQWFATIWPLNCESRLAAGASALKHRVNAPASTLEPNYVFLLPLTEPDRPWSELSWLDCWIALLSKDASSRGMAIDCLIMAIDDGRAASDLAAVVLVRLSAGDWVKTSRIAESLTEVSRVSSLHCWWVANLLQEYLVQIETLPNDIHHLMALLMEQLSELEIQLAPQTIAKINSVKLTGKAGKLANEALKVKSVGQSEKRVAALERALEARVNRAMRWSKSSEP